MPGSRYLTPFLIPSVTCLKVLNCRFLLFLHLHASFIWGSEQCTCPWAYLHGSRKGLVAAASPMCLMSISKLRSALAVPPASTVHRMCIYAACLCHAARCPPCLKLLTLQWVSSTHATSTSKTWHYATYEVEAASQCCHWMCR